VKRENAMREPKLSTSVHVSRITHHVFGMIFCVHSHASVVKHLQL